MGAKKNIYMINLKKITFFSKAPNTSRSAKQANKKKIFIMFYKFNNEGY